jgi:predicted dehydrogenase
METLHMSTTPLSRRKFIAASAAVLGAPCIIPSSALGADGAVAPSNRINIGCIGVGGMGGGHASRLRGDRDVQVMAVCDVDYSRANMHRQGVEKAYAAQMASGTYRGCASYNDFRELIARTDIDAIMCAAPDHWHALISIAAMKSGKDVYVEKPMTLTIEEGRRMAQAAQRYGRVLQNGSQQRSDSNFRRGCELVRNGRIGKVHTVQVGIAGNNSGPNENFPEMPIPEGFDYNLWLGPAPWAPYTQNRCHYKFRFIRDYSGGQTTNWGAHHLDIAQWGLGMDDSGPVEINGVGSRFPADGLYNVPDLYYFEATYASGVKLVCGNQVLPGGGTRFIGDKGWVQVNRGMLRAEPAGILKEVIGPAEIRLYESRSHWGNFFDCMRTRRQPICNAEVGHRSSTACHLGNIAMLLQRTVKWDPKAERFINDPEADRMISRPMRGAWYL